ncbi:response regulator [Haloarcula nitratireducens]|uniref:Response regulator n=1 Tax=Haloarcula nitratireducens TaxID=2487749 RepID=A0AAW4PJB1_9EURY|nr:response regulator [Halomicroarcula nitratireducens]MBX0298054.1 response regulator [Halomicroarcula nitratireducens]
MNAGDILLVEDNPAVARLVIEAFEEAQLDQEVVFVSSGEAALEKLPGHHGSDEFTPAFILLDIDLPGIDGLTVVSEIRETAATESLPIVLFSSTRDPDTISEGYRRGANAYVQKPADYAEMVQFADVLNTFWFQVANLPPEAQ